MMNGAGQGIIMANDGQVATYNIQGFGPHNGPIVHGLHIYSTNSTGKLAFLKNLTGLHTSEVDGNKQTIKIWEWK